MSDARDIPAFPQHGWTKDPEVLERMGECRGMTLRDYFAAKALHALITNPEGRFSVQRATGAASPEGYANVSYQMADTMLNERNRRRAT